MKLTPNKTTDINVKASQKEYTGNLKTVFSIGIDTNLSLQMDMARGKTSRTAWIAQAIEDRLSRIHEEKSLHDKFIELQDEVINIKNILKI